MGIYKADVRFIIHQSVPQTLKGCYQETGRAACDGKPSDCHLYFSYNDVITLRKIIEKGEGSLHLKKRQGALLEKVVGFCVNCVDCRPVELLRYFGESFPRSICGTVCDSCRTDVAIETTGYTKYTVAILALVRLHGGLISSQCVNFIMGKETQLRGKGLEYYSIAKHIAKRDMQRVIGDLQAEGAFEEHSIMNRMADGAIHLTFLCNVALNLCFDQFALAYIEAICK
ncbi:hypothetical protein F5Y09DRAFT_147902 [Xylaria sp. FL1042]|nr:hypothetical protein F5Y09DRAFT_147902 [Xylaria sp. FL1042]